MTTLTLSIATGDYLDTSIVPEGLGVELISNVSASTANGITTYDVTVPSGVYDCNYANTAVDYIEHLADSDNDDDNIVTHWVLGTVATS